MEMPPVHDLKSKSAHLCKATFEKGTGYIITEDFLKEALTIRGENGKK